MQTGIWLLLTLAAKYKSIENLTMALPAKHFSASQGPEESCPSLSTWCPGVCVTWLLAPSAASSLDAPCLTFHDDCLHHPKGGLHRSVLLFLLCSMWLR